MRYKVPLVIHVAESASEIEEVRRKYGTKPFEHLESLGILGPHLIADHCVHLDDGEIRRMVNHDVKAITNPQSNMKLASGIAPVPRLLAQGLTVGLGTDGCASNNNMDLFEEMDTTAKLHKVGAMDPTVLDAFTVLKWRLSPAQRHWAWRIASCPCGRKKADVIVVDTHKPHPRPCTTLLPPCLCLQKEAT
jgi:5-methylthioadenosine/S-adenosylhomocysteine deaminase